MTTDLHNMNNEVRAWLREVVPFIEALLQRERRVETKADERDLVSDIDKEVERFLRAKIKKQYPNHNILGEENASSFHPRGEDHVWIIDPIDGTANFLKQKDEFCILIAYYEQGVGKLGYIYDVGNKHLYYAIDQQGAFKDEERLTPPAAIPLHEGLVSCDVRNWYRHKTFSALIEGCFDIRYYGCGGIDSIHVFLGKLTAFITTRSGPWDAAAQLIFAKELGLRMVRFDGRPLHYLEGGAFILANEGSAEEILTIMKHFEQES